jgi:hypothetical protein
MADVVIKEGAFIIPLVAGVSGVEPCIHDRSAPTHEEIAKLAYCFYESRGRQDGYQMEDWLRAEQELVHHYE